MKNKIIFAAILLVLSAFLVCHSLLDLEKFTVILLNLVLSIVALALVYFKDSVNSHLVSAEKKLDESHFLINSNFNLINAKIGNINLVFDEFSRRSLLQNILYLLKSNIDIVRNTIFFIFKLESASFATSLFNVLKIVSKFAK